MNKHQELIDAVIEQIKTDVRGKDMTAVEELLCALPVEKLIGFLPEEYRHILYDIHPFALEYTEVLGGGYE